MMRDKEIRPMTRSSFAHSCSHTIAHLANQVLQGLSIKRSLSIYVALQKTDPHMGWLDAFNNWAHISSFKPSWIEESGRASSNRAIHTAVAVLTYRLEKVPVENYNQFRRAANHPQIARDAAVNAVSKWAMEQHIAQPNGKMELQPIYEVNYHPERGAHACYVAELVSCVCYLENWAVFECTGEGSNRKEARNEAAKKLIEGGKYCMFWVHDRR